MPSVSTAMIALLGGVAAVTDIIGTGTGTKIHKKTVPEKVTLPYIRIEVFEGVVNNHLGGNTGLSGNLVQIDAYDATSDDAFTLAEAIRLALEQTKGLQGGLVFEEILSSGSYREDDDKPVEGSDQRRFFLSRDYDVLFFEPVT